MLTAVAGSSTSGRASSRPAPKRAAAAKRAVPQRAAEAKRATPARESAKESATAENPLAGAFGGVLRGSVNSVMGSVGLNVPLRAIERLTGAVERAASLLERVERTTRHIDEIEFIDRLYDSFQVLADLRKDTRAMRARVDELESEMRDLQTLLTERLDRVPLMRPNSRERKAARATVENGG